MGETLFLPIAIIIGILVWLTMKRVVAVHQSVKQLQIAAYGVACEGKVVAIQRPFMLDDCTRLYFDYKPAGAKRPLRACHVARRGSDKVQTAMPAAGSVVSVRYLPDEPRQAVIRKLVA
jgi:hypothetical protein